MEEFKIIDTKFNRNIITVKDFNRITGIGINKIYDLVNIQDFPSVRIGKKYYIISSMVDEWFKNNVGKQL
jgi:predicted DNA-binding transcriptional regulator AlpA